MSCGHKGCSLPEVSVTSFLPLQFFVFLLVISGFRREVVVVVIIIIIIIIIIINCNWVVTRWQWLFYMYTKYEIDY